VTPLVCLPMSAIVQSETSGIISSERTQRAVAGRSLNAFICYSLSAVILLMAVPYGSVEPWWKALFQCAIFLLAAVSVVGNSISWPRLQVRLFLPLFMVAGFALVQTIGGATHSDNTSGIGSAISADPYQTRLFAIYLMSLLTLSWLITTHVKNQRRVYQLVDTIVTIGFLSAAFGLWRQLTQQSDGFFLAGLKAGFGYGQFINANHFAYLMEMALGLIFGAAAAGGLRGVRLPAYLVAAAPITIGLVLSGSRGGILSLVCLVPLAALILFRSRQKNSVDTGLPKASVWHRGKSILIQLLLIVLLLSATIMTVVYVGGEPLNGKLATLNAEFDRSTADTYVLRTSTWRATWNLIKNRPLAGAGFGGYWIAITKYHAASGEITPQEAHNDYLELMASGGLIGLALALWFLIEFIRAARRNLKSDDGYMRPIRLGALASIVAVAIHSLVDFGLHIPVNAFVFVAIASLVLVSATPHGPNRSLETST
jgi:O-antigen ligase